MAKTVLLAIKGTITDSDLIKFSGVAGIGEDASIASVDVSDAVSKKHEHSNKTELDKVTDGDHDVRVDNPHTVTKTQLSLENVTNDAQLKREAADIDSFDEKASPISADLILIEDSADSNNKKKIQLGNIPIDGGSF